MTAKWFIVAVVGTWLCAESTPAAAQQADVKDLPLIEVVAIKPSRTIAVFLSGDGGWAAIDKAIAGALQKHGVSVVGINSLKYFWRTRTPEGGAADLERVIRHYRATWYADTVIVIGFSRGAAVMPFMVNRISEADRKAVVLMALVGAERTAGFKFHALDLVNMGSSKGELPVMPEIEKLSGVPVICFYGEKEDDTVCPDLKPPHVGVKLPGGHHMDGHYAEIGDRIFEQLAALKKR
jgi:type IV secretory pathway VirJ component